MKLTDAKWGVIRERVYAEVATMVHVQDEVDHVADAIMAVFEEELGCD